MYSIKQIKSESSRVLAYKSLEDGDWRVLCITSQLFLVLPVEWRVTIVNRAALFSVQQRLRLLAS